MIEEKNDRTKRKIKVQLLNQMIQKELIIVVGGKKGQT